MTLSTTGEASSSAIRQVLFAGNPNSGKTTLFNLLTGARGKVSNYPGVTVDKKTAELELPTGRRILLVDLPGSYSLTARSAEERVAVDAVLDEGASAASAIVCVADATTLRRGLYFVSQLRETGRPTVVALTMMDEARRAGIEIDVHALAEALGCPVIPLVAPKGEGKAQLLAAIEGALTASPPPGSLVLPDDAEADVEAIEHALGPDARSPEQRRLRRARAIWALLSLGDDELGEGEAKLRRAVVERRAAAAAAGRDLSEELIVARYRGVDALLDRVLQMPETPKRAFSSRIDDVLVHPLYGFVAFVVVMAMIFQALFSWSEPAVALIESAVGLAKEGVRSVLPPGAFTDLLANGVVAGAGNVVVFVPQIALLFVFITILEDSGYLARVAFVIDRLMGGVGLHGRAFVPMLSGFACAIPAVMATRTIESRRDRLLTMMVVPLTSCSARLPVYVLITATVFDPERTVLGVMSLGALVLLSMYGLSVFAAIAAAFVLRRTVLKGPRPTLVLELPPYRLPRIRNIVLATWDRVKRFLVDAGTVILALTVVLWGLLTYPKDPAIAERYDQKRVLVADLPGDDASRADASHALDFEQASDELKNSLGGRIGLAMEPALEPLGFDWRVGIGILGAFAAREVFVSTLGVVFGVGEADEASPPLREALRSSVRADGTPLFTPLSGVALMVFFVLACQCMSTIAVVRRESGTWRWPAFMFAYMSVLAYGVTFAVFQVGRLLGYS